MRAAPYSGGTLSLGACGAYRSKVPLTKQSETIGNRGDEEHYLFLRLIRLLDSAP